MSGEGETWGVGEKKNGTGQMFASPSFSANVGGLVETECQGRSPQALTPFLSETLREWLSQLASHQHGDGCSGGRGDAWFLVRESRPERQGWQVSISKYTVEAKSSPAPHPPISFQKENVRGW